MSYFYKSILIVPVVFILSSCASKPADSVVVEMVSAKRDPYHYLCKDDSIAAIGSQFNTLYSSRQHLRLRAEIEAVFKCNYSALKAIYLNHIMTGEVKQYQHGDVQFEATISSEGKIISVSIVYTDIHNDSFEQELVAFVKEFTFPARDVATIKAVFPVNFKP